MNIRRIITLAFISAILAGCDVGDRNEGACGVRPDNKNVVVGYNNERCKEDRRALFLTVNMENTGLATVPENDEAREGIKERIAESVSLTAQQKIANADNEVITWAFWSVSLIIAFIAIVWTLFRVYVISRAVQEIDPMNPEKPRYSHWAGAVVLIGVVALIPTSIDGYTTVATYYMSVKEMHSGSAEALAASIALSAVQSGEITHNDFMSEEAKPFTITRAKAKSYLSNMVRAELADTRTSKFILQRENLYADVTDRKVEYATAPSIQSDVNGWTMFRPVGNKNSPEFAQSILARLDATTDFALKPQLLRKVKLISNGYLSDDASNVRNDIEAFKKDLMDSVGMDKPNQDINNAVIVQSQHIENHLIKSFYYKNRAAIKALVRLQEEYQCSFPTASKITDYHAFSKPQRTYIEYLTGKRQDPAYDSAISCIGEPEPGKFVIYGMRPKEAVIGEIRTAATALMSLLEPVIEKIQSAQILTVTDAVNGNACVKARKELGPGFAANYFACVKSSLQNKAQIQALSNTSLIAYGAGSYVDTNLELKENNAFSTLMDADFDQVVIDTFSHIESKASLKQMGSEEFLKATMENNIGNQSGMEASIKFLLSPFATFKQDIGWVGKECDKDNYTCFNPIHTLVGFTNMADRMMESGTFIALSSFGMSKILNKVNKADDKSRSSSKLNGKKSKGNDKSMVRKGAKALEFILAKFIPLGILIAVAGLLIKWILVIPTLVFVIASILITIDILVRMLLAVVMFIKFCFPNDKDSFKSNMGKLAGDYLYGAGIKVVLIISIVLFYSMYAFIMFGVAMICMTVASQGFVESIYMSLILIPMLYMITQEWLRACLSLLKTWGKICGADDTVLKGTEETVNYAFMAVTFGIPLIFLLLRRK